MNTTKKLNIVLLLGILESISVVFAAFAKVLHLFDFEMVFLLFWVLKIIAIFSVFLIIKELKISLPLKLSCYLILILSTLIAGVLLYVLLNTKQKETV
jgi:hypothetical protein